MSGSSKTLEGASPKRPAPLRRLDLIRVNGMSRRTRVYEAPGHHTSATFPRLASVFAAYEASLDCYQHRDWARALSRFGEALELAPRDRPSRIFSDRCRYYAANPPSDGWDGVWITEQK